MDFPFYRSQRPKPSVSSFYGPTTARGIPLRPEPEPEKTKTKTKTKTQTPTPTPTRKVVQIPVHFVGSESAPAPVQVPDRSHSALKIQKVFRGFLVRKSVKKIMAIKKQVDEIEAGVCRREEEELIKKDAKERLKVNEMLMALLLKLDSVRGVDSGVRDCRRAVIKKAIALQERVDAIASSSSGNDPIRIEAETPSEEKQEDQVLEIQDLAAGAGYSVKSDSFEDQDPQNSDVVEFDDGSGQGSEERNNGGKVDGIDKESLIEDKCPEDVMNAEEESEAQNCEKQDVGGDSETIAEEKNCVEDAMKKEEEIGVDSEMKVDEEACVEKQMLENVEKSKNCTEVQVGSLMEDNRQEMWEKTRALSECVEEEEESVETSQMEDGIGGEEENDVRLGMGCEGRKDGGDDTKRNSELLERMVEENEKMMKLMTQICERNEVQTRMLNTLTHRVEQLEKAFVCDKIKRKKKRHSA